jgi:hypothetical protein
MFHTGRHRARELGQLAESPQAFIALATHLDGREPQTVGSLLSVPRPGLFRRFGLGRARHAIIRGCSTQVVC